MRIDRLRVNNFRNLADLDLRLEPSAVIVGENRSGKSNLVHALRLVLDPALSKFDRYLGRSDFWDGLSDGSDDWDPMASGEVIEISVEIVDFEDDAKLMVALSDALVQESEARARLTYRFAPMDTGTDTGPVKYRPTIFGGDNEDQLISSDLRGYLYMAFLHALRDAETDLASWHRSPLRTLLEAAAKSIEESDLGVVREAMKEANAKINDLSEIKNVGADIAARVLEIVGDNQALETELAVAPDDPLRLIRNMKLYVDGSAHRHLGSTSLGTLNVLYLALLELGLEQRLRDADIAHVVMAIEEPEAHLHPHMQRLVFKRLLTEAPQTRTALVTTQSPHIASVASPRSLVLLRTVNGQTAAAAAHQADLSPQEWDDLARYLDATRAELVFARRVLLVEGYAEQVLVPQLARSCGMDLDKLGITVCSVSGTHFGTYVAFCEALEIPWAVLTDGDGGAGANRAANLVQRIRKSGPPADHGIFVGGTTFEHDVVLADSANVGPFFDTLRELGSASVADAINGWGGSAPSCDELISVIGKVGGKGRFAQRVALHKLVPAAHVRDALEYLAAQ
ncbi:AAA family ATPase [Saccharopolyspora indica]|uniref:ATP-dependent nuclease n=1 Tax=Saccharopolyspora indica TaxID=1229659 RepID=UPI0022EA2A61|nr:AAA family ATPase [Saccharopolyspora indica]MDA3646634.1 AAA family ATPase [Saccharopolyspora indica]